MLILGENGSKKRINVQTALTLTYANAGRVWVKIRVCVQAAVTLTYTNAWKDWVKRYVCVQAPLSLMTLDTVASIQGGKFQHSYVFLKKNMLCEIKLGTLICHKKWGSRTRFPTIKFLKTDFLLN